MIQSNSVTISRDQSAAMKGLLICLVVLGHNIFFADVFPNGTWNWLYTFHVSCFFVLPFFYKEHTFSMTRVKTNAKRLLWPYTYMFLLLFLVNCFVRREASIDYGLFNTYLTGNEYRLKEYVGFQYLWFLPAMFSMLLIKDVFTSSGKLMRKVLLIIGGIFFIMCWVFFFSSPYNDSINKTIAMFSVLSFMLGWAMVFLGQFTRYVVNILIIPKWFSAVVLAMSLVLIVLYYDNKSIYPWIIWGARAICPIAGFTLLLNGGEGYNNLIFRKIGDLSLPIYLFHQPVNFLICSFLTKTTWLPAIQLTISYFSVLIVSYLLAVIFKNIKVLNKIMFIK